MKLVTSSILSSRTWCTGHPLPNQDEMKSYSLDGEQEIRKAPAIISLGEPPTCSRCGEALTVFHVLLICPQLKNERKKHFFKAYRERIPFHLSMFLVNQAIFDHTLVINFLKESKSLQVINSRDWQSILFRQLLLREYYFNALLSKALLARVPLRHRCFVTIRDLVYICTYF